MIPSRKKIHDYFKYTFCRHIKTSAGSKNECSTENLVNTTLKDSRTWRKLSFRYDILPTSTFILSGLLYYLIWHAPNSSFGECEYWSTNYAGIVNRSISLRDLSNSPLKVFQVYQPVTIQSTINNGDMSVSEACEVQLMEYSFGNSYGKPFIGEYTPPPCKFNQVVINFTATSQGRQFDRLAIMYLNDIEVWRTSTAEPNKKGIVFEYIKDMSAYMSLWTSSQKLIFDLGNLIDNTYTGPFNTTLTASFSMVNNLNQPADLIIPVSPRKSDQNAPSVFKLPPEHAINTITFPQNVNRAVFSISACGQGNEEFWWQNVLQSNTKTFKDIELYGYSPFRELQLLIDGQLAGVQWPFPVIFTGGVAPGLWRPIVGIDTYDLREHEIDITPWLAILSDGDPHTFEIRVAGIKDNDGKTGTLTKSVGNNWLITGKIFLWLDSENGTMTTGSQLDIKIDEPVIKISSSVTQNTAGANETLTYTVDVTRTLSITSTIITAKGPKKVSWTQNLISTSSGYLEAYGNVQVNKFITTGIDESTGFANYKSNYSYPLYCKTSGTINEAGNFSIDTQISRGLALTIEGSSVYPTGIEPFIQNTGYVNTPKNPIITHLNTAQNGTAHYSSISTPKLALSYGETSQIFSFLGSIDGEQTRELYYRNVVAQNETLISDQERIFGSEIYHPLKVAVTSDFDIVFPRPV